VPEDGKVRRAIVLAHPPMIFIERDVQHPMQRVFDTPMATHGVEHTAGIAIQAGDKNGAPRASFRRSPGGWRRLCHACSKSYSEQSALPVRGSWYAREVHRAKIDHWRRLGTSLRRTAEVLRSWLVQQERFLLWRPLAEAPPAAQ